VNGNWKLLNVRGQAKTKASSGNKMVFEGEVQRNLFDGVLSQRHAEQFGKLTLKSGKNLYFDGEVKMIRNDRRKKDGEQAICNIQIVPTMPMKPKQFGDMYGALDTHFEAEFVEVAQPKQSKPPKAEDLGPQDGSEPVDDNVVPGSTAADLKANARKKLSVVKGD
jgi:hypothetical protein